MEQVNAEMDAAYAGAEITENTSTYAWIRKWGFGPVAYLMDFLDPVFKSDVLKEFKAIHKAVMRESPENTPEYRDSFDIASKIAKATPESQLTLLKELRKFKKAYDPVVFKLSANSVQIMKALKVLKWFIDPNNVDYAADFITKYDINHDGRMSPKELILGSIMYQKPTLGSKKCKNCYGEVSRKIAALFTYLDCTQSGFVSADQLWAGLPNLRRGTNQFNIFGYHNSDNIRTNAVNDFILKNEKAKDAVVSREEFITGILLGIWDRQVSDHGIVEDDSRNLKKLRWKSHNMVDTVANTYVKAVTRKRIEDEIMEQQERQKKKAVEKKAAAEKAALATTAPPI